MVHDRNVHGAKHPIRHRAWAGNLQKMAALVLAHGFPHLSLGKVLHSKYSRLTKEMFTFLLDDHPIEVYVPPDETSDSA
jgi:hypothetical protein